MKRIYERRQVKRAPWLASQRAVLVPVGTGSPAAAFAVLALLALPACENPADGPPAEAWPEISRGDFDSDVAYRNAKRRAAFAEMHSMPPDEYRDFMRRNQWKRRWPEMWGPDELREPGFRIVAGAAPVPYPDAEVMGVFRALYEHDPDVAEEGLAVIVHGAELGSGARASLQDLRGWALARWTEMVEKHARSWDGERCDHWVWGETP